MQIVKQSHKILKLDGEALQQIETAGRTCYQSQDKVTEKSAEKFVEMLQKRNHMAMIEFADMTVKFVTNRGVTHELVRHRMCSFAQESTRYVKYDGDMEFIKPVWCKDELIGKYNNDRILENFHKMFPGPEREAESIFVIDCFSSERTYQQLLEYNWRPEQAREVLPNSLKTEICVKANLREWLHIFSLRTSKAAHPQIRELMLGLLNDVAERLPSVFGGI